MGESYGDWLGESTKSIWLRDLDLIQDMDLNLLRVTWRFFFEKKHKKMEGPKVGCDFVCFFNLFLLGCVVFFVGSKNKDTREQKKMSSFECVGEKESTVI